MLTRDQVFAVADKYGEFQYGDAQGDKRQQFAADLIAAHQRMRDAAPELLAALQELCALEADGMQAAESAIESWGRARAALAKATGGAL